MIRRLFSPAYPRPRSSQCKDPMSKPETPAAANFLRPIVQADLARSQARTPIAGAPPEPSGYLHVGQAAPTCLPAGPAEAFGGQCDLRSDAPSPAAEQQGYLDAIREDVRWLGFPWARGH